MIRLLVASCLLWTLSARAADKVLRVASITDAQLLDPVFGTAWVNVVAGHHLLERQQGPSCGEFMPYP